MKKKGLIVLIIAVVFFIGAIALMLYAYYFHDVSNETNKSEEEIVETIEEENETTENETEGNETIAGDDFPNAEEIHWSHMPLTYKINNKKNCEGTPLGKMEDALKSLELATNGVIKFDEVEEEDVDVEINCISGLDILNGFGNNSITCKEFSFDYVKKYIDPYRESLIDWEDYLINMTKTDSNVSADDTVYEVCYIDSSSSTSENNYDGLRESELVIEGEIIKSHKISIFESGEGWNSCAKFPAREMHELLHGFGFKHSDEPKFDPYYGWPPQDLKMLGDVMFATRFCVYQTKLDDKYPSCLKRIFTGEGSCEGVRF